MTESEARKLLDDNVGEDLCVTYAVRRDGSIRFRPEPEPTVVPITALTRRRKTAAAAAAVGLSAALAACAPHDNPDVRSEVVIAETQAPTDPLPTIPTAEDPPAEEPPAEELIDGGIGAVEPEIEPPPVPAGGITVEPLPPPDEPCDTQEQADEPRDRPLRRGGVRRRRPL